MQSWVAASWLVRLGWLGCLSAVPLAAQVPAAPPVPADHAAPATGDHVAHGRLEQHGGIRLLRVWGTAEQRGYAHGRLLAADFAAVALPEFQARFGSQPALLTLARGAVGRLIEYPDDVATELKGLWQGLVDSRVDLAMPKLERSFDFVDLQVANALDVFGLMGCSSFTVWGEQVDGGGVLTGRNFDWPLTGPHLLEHTVLVVQHFAEGGAVASVGWPGFVGTVTGVSHDGMLACLHVGTGKITRTPEPSSWPSAIAARRILARGAAGGTDAVWAFATEQLGFTSPPAGYLTHVVLPSVPSSGPPVAAFETDAKSTVCAAAVGDSFVLTNHFRQRKDGREAAADSLDREQRLGAGIAGCITTTDQVVSIDEAWQMLGSVERGGRRGFGTLHSLVFRHAPWHFELRIATPSPAGLVAAPASQRRHLLTKEQLFVPAERLGLRTGK
jgi:hypothetical protein